MVFKQLRRRLDRKIWPPSDIPPGITLREVEVQQVVGLETKQVTMIGKEKEEEEEEMVMMMAEIRNKDLLQNNKILINILKI